MLVKLLTSYSGAKGSFIPGSELDMETKEAQVFIEKGLAEAVKKSASKKATSKKATSKKSNAD